MKYKVLRQHYGDKQYVEGDMREIPNEQDAKSLAIAGLIELDEKEDEDAKAKTSSRAKAAPKPKNKMAEEPSNKAE